MASDDIRRLLVSQRRRLVGTILGFAERELYGDLTDEQKLGFRTKVLNAVDAYHELTLDIIGATNDPNEIINTEALELLRDIRDQLARDAPGR